MLLQGIVHNTVESVSNSLKMAWESISAPSTPTGAHVISVTQANLNLVTDGAGESFQYLGIAIGGIMLLFIAFYYIASLLDGGKFQIKMLLPFLIYFFVCHFSFISKPTASFLQDITGALVDAADSMYISTCERFGGEGCTSIGGVWMAGQLGHIADNEQSYLDKRKAFQDGQSLNLKEVYSGYNNANSTNDKTPLQQDLDEASVTPNSSSSNSSDGKASPKKTTAEMTDEEILDEYTKDSNWFEASLTKIWNRICWSLFPEWRPAPFDSVWMLVVCLLFGLVDIVANALGFLGAVMMGIIFLFGPLTFAFALFPGSSSTIKSWFIRLCQFSLYAPIAWTLKAFCVNGLGVALQGSSYATVTTGVGLGIISLVVITSVPSIASMIIEGAQGAVSLSQGLQTITSMTGTVTSIFGGTFALARKSTVAFLGKENKLVAAAAGAKHLGVVGSVNAFSGGFDAGVDKLIKTGYAVSGIKGNLMEGIKHMG